LFAYSHSLIRTAQIEGLERDKPL